MTHTPRPIQIPLPHTDIILQGTLHQPAESLASSGVAGSEAGGGAGGAVVCHPHPAFGGNMDNDLVLALTNGLARTGRPALRFNFRGVGGSTGKGTGGVEEHKDVLACLEWMEDHAGAPPRMVGYSFGAGMALEALAKEGRASSLCCVGFPTTVAGSYPHMVAAGDLLTREGPPMLFLCGDHDQFCEPHWLRQNLAGPRIRVEVMQGEGHFFEGEAIQRVVDRVVAFMEEV